MNPTGGGPAPRPVPRKVAVRGQDRRAPPPILALCIPLHPSRPGGMRGSNPFSMPVMLLGVPPPPPPPERNRSLFKSLPCVWWEAIRRCGAWGPLPLQGPHGEPILHFTTPPLAAPPGGPS
jgi:hypothetical protein